MALSLSRGGHGEGGRVCVIGGSAFNAPCARDGGTTLCRHAECVIIAPETRGLGQSRRRGPQDLFLYAHGRYPTR